MSSEVTIFGCQYKYPWLLLIFLQYLLCFSVIATFFTIDWCFGHNFTSSLRFLHFESETINILDDTQTVCDRSESSPQCQILIKLRSGLYIYTTFCVLSTIFIIGWKVCALLLSKQKNFYISGCIFGFLSFFSYILAVFSWVYKTKVNATECGDDSEYQSSTSICFGPGFKFNLLIIGLTPLVLYVFFLLGGVSLKKLNLEYTPFESERPRPMEETYVNEV